MGFRKTDTNAIQNLTGSDQFFKAREGDNLIRVLPPTDALGDVNNNSPFYLTWSHWIQGFGSVVCKKRMGNGKCLVCNAVNAVNWEREEDKVNYVAKRKWRCWILELDTRGRIESPVPKLWDIGVKSIRSLEEGIKENGDITDVTNGRNVKVTRTGIKRNTDYTIILKGQSSPIGDEFWEWLENNEMPELLDTLKDPDEQALTEALDELFSLGAPGRRGDDDEDDDDRRGSRGSRSAARNIRRPATSTRRSRRDEEDEEDDEDDDVSFSRAVSRRAVQDDDEEDEAPVRRGRSRRDEEDEEDDDAIPYDASIELPADDDDDDLDDQADVAAKDEPRSRTRPAPASRPRPARVPSAVNSAGRRTSARAGSR